MDAIIGDSKKKSAKELARQMRQEQKEEGRWGMVSNLLKTGLQFVPGVGTVGASLLGSVIDPIGRAFGAGADAEDISLSGKNIAFGGKGDAEMARLGLQDYLDMAGQRNITSSIAGLVAAGGADKFKDWLGFGKGGVDTGVGMSNMLNPSSIPSGFSLNLPQQATEAYEIGLPFPVNFAKQGTSPFNLPTYAEGGEVASSKTYEQGGMVQKYQEGGQIKRTETQRVKTNPSDPTSPYETTTTTVWDTYEYDGVNWNKTGTGLETDPGLTNMTQSEMDSYRSEERTAAVSSQYMDDPSEHGIQEFLRTPAVFALVEKARGGSAGALENLVEMLRQSRPDLDKTNDELRVSLRKILPKMDLYGEGYQGVLAGAETTLEGLTGQAQAARGQQATQQATSGIRRPGTTGTISEALYTGAEDVYAGMQKDIQGEFDKEFVDFEKMIANPNL